MGPAAGAPVRLGGLAEIAPLYRGLIVDLWGTLHDGRRAFDGAIATLTRLRASGISICLLSNAPRPVTVLAAHLAGMGIGADCFDCLMSSGQATIDALRDRRIPWTRNLGRSYYVIGPPDIADLLQGLAFARVADPGAAEFVLATGATPGAGLTDYDSALRRCLKHGLPMICANPDRFVLSGDARVMCAGTIARRYAELGGRVHAFGKPARAIYRQCLQRMGCAPGVVLAIGDGLETDIAGARHAGLKAAFIPGPLYAGDPGTGADPASPDRLARLFARTGHRPDYILPAIRW